LLPPPLVKKQTDWLGGGERLENSGIAGAEARIEKYVSGYKNANSC